MAEKSSCSYAINSTKFQILVGSVKNGTDYVPEA